MLPDTTPHVPVGRGAALGRFAVVLDERRPAVVAVTGPAASGKSVLVSACCELAARSGYLVVAGAAGRGLPLRPTTDLGEFLREVRHGLSPASSGLDRSLAKDGGHSVSDLAAAVLEAAQQQPVLLAIDPFRPSQALERDFQRHLFRVLRRRRSPIVVMLTARRSLEELAPDLSLMAHAPDPDSVRRHLRRITSGLDPPVADSALERYVAAVVDDVNLLTSLTSLLPLGNAARRAGLERVEPT